MFWYVFARFMFLKDFFFKNPLERQQQFNVCSLYCSLTAFDVFWSALGRSWAPLGPLLAALGHFGAALGRSCAALGRSWAALVPLLAALGPLLGGLGPLLGAQKRIKKRSKIDPRKKHQKDRS